jgi:hypothetical protein
MKASLNRLVLAAVTAIAASMALVPLADAAGGGGRGGGGGGGGGGGARATPQASGGGGARAGGDRQAAQVNNTKADARTNNTRSTSVNNVNNTNVNVNRNVNVQGNSGCCNNGWDNDYHPVATAAAVTATAVVIGSIVARPPAGCVPVNYGGMVYQQCGSTWYAPQGSQYAVVNPPY